MIFQRFVAIAPTYNNARTLAGVLDALRDRGLDVIVVNDGSTDATESVLDDRIDCVVVRHLKNEGKAAAMRSGFAAAVERGYTHALTFDTDGQHDARDVPALLEVSSAHPAALILGSRDKSITGYPFWNRVGRAISDGLVRLNGGVLVTDSQCGLRVYPLQTRLLPVRASRYGFETEILVRCGWAGVPVIEVPVRCVYDLASGRVSHFRPWRDSLSAVAMHLRLFLRSLGPVRPTSSGEGETSDQIGTIFQRLARWLSPMRAWRAIRHDLGERRRFAAALSVGVLVANLPVYGLQSLLSLILARRLKLHPLAVLAGSHLSIPPIGPVLIASAITVGHLLLHGTFATVDEFDPSRIGYVELLRRVALEWTLGGVICGVTLAGVTFLSARFLMRMISLEPANAPARLGEPAVDQQGLS